MRTLLILLCCCSLCAVGCQKSAAPPEKETNEVAVDEVTDSDVRPHRQQETAPIAGMGILVGEVTDNSVLAQVRTCKTDQLVERDVPGMPGVVEFELFDQHKDDSTRIALEKRVVETARAHDYIARVEFTDLQPNAYYHISTRLGNTKDFLKQGPKAEFRTLAGADLAVPFKFVVVTGMNYAKFHGDDRIDQQQHLLENNTALAKPYSGKDKHLGYPALETILKMQPDFFVGTGDNVYYDTPKNPRAKTNTEMRQKWYEQFRQPRYRDLFAAVPTYWEIDDHDYRVDDGDNTGDFEPSPELAQRIMLEQLPYAPMNAESPITYRTHRLCKDLQIWLTENRIYRSPNAMPDGPEKSIWGQEQKEWLKRTLSESDAKFKVLISPTPMIGPDDKRKTDNHTNVGGFQHERDEFFAWLKETGLHKKHFYLVCGDRHWQYHAIHPTGIEEFSCGALIDENA